ncbi:MAG: TIGR02391 family protein [Verrucomicrobiota bacterium]|jgi:uncharacterized protein (TIGR02391 family)
MDSNFTRFEAIARGALAFTDASTEKAGELHPFESRDVHPRLPQIVRDLFDDGHFAQATFEAFKYIDKEIQRLSGDSESGFKLMMKVLPETSPVIKLTKCSTTSEKDEQKGFQFLFAGSVLAIRNPRGHEYGIRDTPDTCLDHLSLASLLIRRLEQAGYVLT